MPLKRRGRISKQVFITAGALAVGAAVLVGGYFLSLRTRPAGVDIRKFTGHLVAVEGEVIRVRGVFFSGGTLPDALRSEREFSFRVDGGTSFRKSELQFPDFGENSEGTFDLADLPRREGPGSFEDLSAEASPEVFIEAEFPSSIEQAELPVATGVLYRTFLIPSLGTTPGGTE